MSLSLVLCAMLLLSGDLFASEPAANGPPQARAHHWQYIEYPWNLPGCPTFMIDWPNWTSNRRQISDGLRLDILNVLQGFPFFKTNAITAVLYRADGEMVEPTAEGKKYLNMPIGISTASVPGMEPDPEVMTYFPWGSNVLEESWIEVTIASERYWLEIPYGFDQNPTEPLAPDNSDGPPQFVPMKKLTEHDHVLHWQSVHYDLGAIQNGWRLSLIQANPFDATGEVVLYRDDTVVGKSMFLWDLHTPRTTLRVVDEDGSIINSLCMSLRLHDDGMRRSDTFNIGRNGFAKVRCWGQIEISVDGKTNCVTVPSSLYKYTHGHVRL